MLGLFYKKEDENTLPDWLQHLEETEKRWYVFLEKLQVKMEELCSTAIPELHELYKTEETEYKPTFGRVYQAIMGQMEHMRSKVSDTFEEKILATSNQLQQSISVFSPNYKLISDFRHRCSDKRINGFDASYEHWYEKIKATGDEGDLEIKYKQILDEYDNMKHKFACRQCGSKLTIDKIFFISTYIACPQCQTQNTFEPSTQARSLQFMSMRLAEQRTGFLLMACNAEKEKERELYLQKHKTHLSAVFEENKKRKAEKEQLEKEPELQRQAAIEKAPPLFEIYLRAKYDEMNKITPDLTKHNEVRYQNELTSFRLGITPDFKS